MSDYYLCSVCGYEVDVLDVLNKKISLEREFHDTRILEPCKECGHEELKTVSIEYYACPKCGTSMIEVRDEEEFESSEIQESEPKIFNIGGRDYSKPLISDSLAINPDQIAEHREKFPDITVLADGRLQFENFRQHDNYLKKTGFNKKTQRKKSVGHTLGGKTIARLKHYGNYSESR